MEQIFSLLQAPGSTSLTSLPPSKHRFRLDGTPILSKEEKLAERIRQGHPLRRPHVKSRTGCLRCKQRKVKCDEGSPRCRRCMTNKSPCVYAKNNRHHGVNVGYIEKPSTCLRSTYLSMTPINPQRTDCEFEETLLHHFASHTCISLIAGGVCAPMAEICLPFALAQPSLLHGILALSSRHMMTLQPENRWYHLAYHHHSQQFFSLFPNDLQKPPSLEMTNLAHSNIFLANVLSSAEPMVHSWVTVQDPQEIDQAFSWIKLQARHQWILRPYAPWLSDCYLQPIFKRAPRSLQLHPATACGITEPLPIESLRDLIAHGSSRRHLLTRGLDLLIESYDPDPALPYLNVFDRSLGFICSMEEEFLHLLHQKDEVALVLFTYWLCHMVGLNLWWFSKASDECRAICCFLKNSVDLRVQALVDYPLRVCDLMVDFRGTLSQESSQG